MYADDLTHGDIIFSHKYGRALTVNYVEVAPAETFIRYIAFDGIDRSEWLGTYRNVELIERLGTYFRI